jgi:hypothetical protein
MKEKYKKGDKVTILEDNINNRDAIGKVGVIKDIDLSYSHPYFVVCDCGIERWSKIILTPKKTNESTLSKK